MHLVFIRDNFRPQSITVFFNNSRLTHTVGGRGAFGKDTPRTAFDWLLFAPLTIESQSQPPTPDPETPWDSAPEKSFMAVNEERQILIWSSIQHLLINACMYMCLCISFWSQTDEATWHAHFLIWHTHIITPLSFPNLNQVVLMCQRCRWLNCDTCCSWLWLWARMQRWCDFALTPGVNVLFTWLHKREEKRIFVTANFTCDLP